MRTITPDDGDPISKERFELILSDDERIEIEALSREDWAGMHDPCPECSGTEFDHVRYEGGHYGQHQGAVIERADYWYQYGSLYTSCYNCNETLHKHPAYDILRAAETGEIDLLD